MAAAPEEPDASGRSGRQDVAEIAAHDGTSIFVRRWWPPGGPWATVLLVHGLAEHSGRYVHVGRWLAEAGLEVVAPDLRGFGRSGGPRASIERWSQHHDDLEERVAELRSGAPARPLVLYGHSMGGLIVLGYVLDGRSRPDLLVLSAPAISARIPLAQRLIVGSVGRVAPGLRVPNGINPAVLCSEPAVGRAYAEDPLCVHRSTLQFGQAGFAEQRRVAGAIDRLTVPTLVVHGGRDRLVPPEVSRGLEGRPSVRRVVYPKLQHEVHNEPDAPKVVADIVAWIRERVSRMPPGHSPEADARPEPAAPAG